MHILDLDRPDRMAAAAVPSHPPMSRRRAAILPVAVTVLALLTGGGLFLSGYSLGRQTSAEPGTPGAESTAFRPFWDTYHTIRDRYAGGDVSRDAIVQGAIRGMIDSLDDPYSQYLTSGQYQSNLQGISGEFEGIGAELATQASDGTASCATLGPTCRLVIVAPIGGSPAEKAGLRAGDLVLATDGVSLDGLTVDAARAKIRGPKGTVLSLSVLRGSAAPFDLKITRDVVLEPEVTSKVLNSTIGYVRLMGFSDRAATELIGALQAHVQAGRKQLVLDLRGNPGGYVTAARVVASQFIGSGTIFWEQDAKGNQTPTDALPGGVATDPAIHVVALIDRGSASASEIVAAALQDTGRATLVGQRSFGKGTVQQWQELPGEGGAFRLTIARWLSPDKRWIHNVGIEPDVTVALPSTPIPGEDPTLNRALGILATRAPIPAG
jgi:carboxyl-terminal processing protease